MSLLELVSQPPPPLYLAENSKHLLVSATDISIPRVLAFLHTPNQFVVQCAQTLATQREVDLFDKLPSGIYSVPDMCLPNSGPETAIIVGLAITGIAIITACGVGAYQFTRPRNRPGTEMVIVPKNELERLLARANEEFQKRRSLAEDLFRGVLKRRKEDPDKIVD